MKSSLFGLRQSSVHHLKTDARNFRIELKACDPVLQRAREHYVQADLVMAGLPKSALKAPYMMSVGYRSILDNLAARGFAPPRAPVHVSRFKLVVALLRHLFS